MEQMLQALCRAGYTTDGSDFTEEARAFEERARARCLGSTRCSGSERNCSKSWITCCAARQSFERTTRHTSKGEVRPLSSVPCPGAVVVPGPTAAPQSAR